MGKNSLGLRAWETKIRLGAYMPKKIKPKI